MSGDCWSHGSRGRSFVLITCLLLAQEGVAISDVEYDAKMRASVKEKMNIVEEFESEEQRSLRRRWVGKEWKDT